MFKEFLQILVEHGALFAVLFVLLMALLHYIFRMRTVWNARDKANVASAIDIQKDELRSHPFFTHAEFKIKAEVPVLQLNGNIQPVRQELFREVVRQYIISMREVCLKLIELDMSELTAAQWAMTVHEHIGMIAVIFDEHASEHKIPDIVVKKFIVWQQSTIETLRSYVSSLAVSKVYTTTNARTNTFLYLMNLVLSTTVADSEKSIVMLNGEITGLQYKSKLID